MTSETIIPPNFVTVNWRNFYKISWEIRNKVALEFLPANPSAPLSDVLNALEEFGTRHLCQLEIASSDEESAPG